MTILSAMKNLLSEEKKNWKGVSERERCYKNKTNVKKRKIRLENHYLNTLYHLKGVYSMCNDEMDIDFSQLTD